MLLTVRLPNSKPMGGPMGASTSPVRQQERPVRRQLLREPKVDELHGKAPHIPGAPTVGLHLAR